MAITAHTMLGHALWNLAADALLSGWMRDRATGAEVGVRLRRFGRGRADQDSR